MEQTGKEYIDGGIKFKARKKTNNKWFETQDSINYSDDFNKQKIMWPCIMSIEPSFILDKDGVFYTIAPGNIITGNNLEYLLGCLNSKTYYFALRNYYMGGGISGELKTNRLLQLPILKYQNNAYALKIESSVKEILKNNEKEKHLNKIEDNIQAMLNLTNEEKEYINNYEFNK